MLHSILNQFSHFCSSKNRWWLPLLSGFLFSLCLPPFNHELHWSFALFPFLTFVALAPFFYFALIRPFKRALLYTFLYSYTMALGQFFWLAFVKIEGLWAIIIVAMFLLAVYVALFYLVSGLIFRWLYQAYPRLSILVFPALWVLIDYSRTLGDLAFPWEFLGYSLTPLLPISQFASLTGVWGLTFLIIMANVIFLNLLTAFYHKKKQTNQWIMVSIIFILSLGSIAVWGSLRIKNISHINNKKAKIALLQPAINQLQWGNNSLEGSFTVIDSMVKVAAQPKPDLIIGPESSLLCYLNRQTHHRLRFQSWADSVHIPILLGAIDWEKAPGGSIYDYMVYNTAFLAIPGEKKLIPYRKIKLVPFSEVFPFEAKFPILSRVNLGEADFKRGTEETVYAVSPTLKAAIFVCYEAIFPGFVQRRLKNDANLIVHITNDGWFGKTTGPYQHAEMSRMRAIENRVPIARSAITGISMFIDPVGRILQQSKLDTREILQENISVCRAQSFYSKHGDWFVGCSLILFSAFLIGHIIVESITASKLKAK